MSDSVPRLLVDPVGDTAYVELRDWQVRVVRTVELGYGINVDLDGAGAPVGYEILSLRSEASS